MKFFKKKKLEIFFLKNLQVNCFKLLNPAACSQFFLRPHLPKNVSRLCNFSLLAIFLRPRLPKNVSRKAENSIFFFLALAIFFLRKIGNFIFCSLACTHWNQLCIFSLLANSFATLLANKCFTRAWKFYFFPNACHFYFLRKLENLIFCSLARKCFWDLACIFFI